ncbi:hypothetical protein FRC03_000588 [Tulasnella sp. 419]|nr:hypothetical protein FRC03_000588 [Tulasnella sp. 419]
MIEDLKEATQCDRDVLLLRPPGHPERPTSLSNLAHSLLRAYGDLGDPSNLEEAVQHSREALKLCSQDHPSRATLLHVLANCLSLIYDKSGNIQHLDEAIQCHKDELIWYPPGHRSRPNSLNDLGSCLFTRFEQQGHSQDLEEAIQHFRTGLSLCLPGNPGRAGLLSNLGACLESQYQYYCDINDLEDATKLYREVLLLHPPGHPGRPMSLNNLGTCIRAQFLRNSVEDVEEAIQCFRESLLLCPSEHPQRSLPVHNLSTCLWLRYKKSNRVEDLEEANQLNRDALKLRPLGHSKRMLSLTNLAGSLVALYEHREDIHYIEEAIQCLHEAIQMSLPNHPALTLQWSALASIHAQYHQILGPVSEPNESTRLFKKAVNHETAILKDRFNASLSWISVEKGPTLMDAYTISLELADQYVLVRSSIASRHQILLEVPATLATNAAATAISSGNLPRAVEFLEQGRSLLWSQISRSRISLHRLEKVNPGLADEFAELSKQLEASAAPNTVDTRPLYSIDDEAQKYRRITVAWHDVVDRIRQLDGFSSFLRPAAFLNLKDAAQQGPIIIINIGNHRCDAIILDTFGQLHLLPLPDIEIIAIIDLYVRFHTVIQRDKPRKGLIEILRCLWDDIVEPIVKKLQELGIQPGSHIWWCPTLHLTMLPLHAAGPHRPGKPNLPDLYVSSYTPTLSGLCKSLQAEVQDQSSSATSYIPRLLVVAQPAVQGQTEIPHVREELQKIIQVASPVDILQDGNATRESVLSSLQTHPWIHFGCHGSQIIDEPFQSCFFVSGQRLTLVDLIQAHLPDAQYALLAACHSAAGDWRRPDEAIHLAAALQFSGFRSVIGTMYAMADIDGPALAEAVYKHMYRRQDEHDGISEVVVDFRETAKALNIATRALRDSGVPLERWINFIHIGA